MKAVFLPALALAALAGCATTTAVPAGMKAGKFVEYACEGGKRLSARAAADGSSVRIRHEGGYELDRINAGVYEGDGWKFTNTTGSVELVHNGKTVARGCKAVS